MIINNIPNPRLVSPASSSKLSMSMTMNAPSVFSNEDDDGASSQSGAGTESGGPSGMNSGAASPGLLGSGPPQVNWYEIRRVCPGARGQVVFLNNDRRDVTSTSAYMWQRNEDRSRVHEWHVEVLRLFMARLLENPDDEIGSNEMSPGSQSPCRSAFSSITLCSDERSRAKAEVTERLDWCRHAKSCPCLATKPEVPYKPQCKRKKEVASLPTSWDPLVTQNETLDNPTTKYQSIDSLTVNTSNPNYCPELSSDTTLSSSSIVPAPFSYSSDGNVLEAKDEDTPLANDCNVTIRELAATKHQPSTSNAETTVFSVYQTSGGVSSSSSSSSSSWDEDRAKDGDRYKTDDKPHFLLYWKVITIVRHCAQQEGLKFETIVDIARAINMLDVSEWELVKQVTLCVRQGRLQRILHFHQEKIYPAFCNNGTKLVCAKCKEQ